MERILLVLSALVADHAEPIQLTVEALADLDLALAKAKYADATRATMPEIVPFEPRTSGPRGDGDTWLHPGSVLDLRQARHPLLDPTDRGADRRLPRPRRLLHPSITGPNTGGKTVSLKTVGLLALMAQCGLHLPVDEGSRLTVFEQVCADIGDEQSIEQSLSTFSSHMTPHHRDARDGRRSLAGPARRTGRGHRPAGRRGPGPVAALELHRSGA